MSEFSIVDDKGFGYLTHSLLVKAQNLNTHHKIKPHVHNGPSLSCPWTPSAFLTCLHSFSILALAAPLSTCILSLIPVSQSLLAYICPQKPNRTQLHEPPCLLQSLGAHSGLWLPLFSQIMFGEEFHLLMSTCAPQSSGLFWGAVF